VYKYEIVICIISLYNKIVMASREIIIAQALAADGANSACRYVYQQYCLCCQLSSFSWKNAYLEELLECNLYFLYFLYTYYTLWFYCKHAKRSSKYFIILPILYDCENWSLTVTEEYQLIIFEGRVLKRVSGPDKEASAKDRKSYNKKIYNLHCSRNFVIIKLRCGSREINTKF
jgi:hypothetical protein